MLSVTSRFVQYLLHTLYKAALHRKSVAFESVADTCLARYKEDEKLYAVKFMKKHEIIKLKQVFVYLGMTGGEVFLAAILCVSNVWNLKCPS